MSIWLVLGIIYWAVFVITMVLGTYVNFTLMEREGAGEAAKDAALGALLWPISLPLLIWALLDSRWRDAGPDDEEEL